MDQDHSLEPGEAGITNAPDQNETNSEVKQESQSLDTEMQDPSATKVEENTNNTNNEETTITKATPPPLPLDWTKIAPDAEDLPPIRYPSDVMEFSKDDTYLEIIGTAGQKITHMGKDLMKQISPDITHLIFRSHLIHKMEGIRGLNKLELLELYDNQVEYLEELEGDGDSNGEGEGKGTGFNLTTLDMSYNVIRSMEPVQFCPNLVELCKCFSYSIPTYYNFQTYKS